MTVAKFDVDGGRLWVDIEMDGLYFTTYTYQLWSASATEPPVLTSPIKNGNNNSPHDDFFPVVNDFNPTEPLDQYHDRTIEVRLWVKKVDDDNGYTLRAVAYQGDDYYNAIELASDEVEGKLGELGVKMESLLILLQKA